MRILYHHRTAASDGMSVHIHELVGALRSDGHEVLVVGPAGNNASGARHSEAQVEILRRLLPKPMAELAELAHNFISYRRLERAWRTFKPDILYERYNLFLLSGLWLKRRRGLPLILEVNSPLAQERAEHGGLALKSLARSCEDSVWSGADCVLPVTGVLAGLVAAARRSRDGILVLPNGVDLQRFARTGPRERLRRELKLEGALVLGFTGFVRPWHGLDWPIRLLKDLSPRVHLLVVGDGPALADLRTLAESEGVHARVHFIGRVDHALIPDYVSAFDIALQPRAVSYASPLKLFEYMAASLPVVAPDQPNIREVVCDHETALLFAPGDFQSFGAAVRRLCEDSVLRERVGRAARRTVETVPYTWQRNAAEIGRLARGLCAPARDAGDTGVRSASS